MVGSSFRPAVAGDRGRRGRNGIVSLPLPREKFASWAGGRWEEAGGHPGDELVGVDLDLGRLRRAGRAAQPEGLPAVPVAPLALRRRRPCVKRRQGRSWPPHPGLPLQETVLILKSHYLRVLFSFRAIS